MGTLLRETGSGDCRATLRILRGGASGLPCLVAVLCLLASGHSQPNPGTYKVLHTFAGSPDGVSPTAGLLRDTQGNLYGTTSGGGVNSASCNNYYYSYCGVVFKIDLAGNETVLYSFNGQPDGSNPAASLIQDSAGNLYGTTSGGGTSGNGTIFKLDTSGKETVLYSFAGSPDGAGPSAELVSDSAGNLYGTTQGGGTSGKGTIFKLDTSANETVLYSFTGQTDGDHPQDLLRDSTGNLYGAAYSGGVVNCKGSHLVTIGCGTIFKLDTTGTFSVLYTFQGPTLDGGEPVGGLVADAAGDLYGATRFGGPGVCECGTIFKLDPTGNEIVLHSFAGPDGSLPQAGLVIDASGNLYGTTSSNLFELDTSGNLTVLYDFSGGADGISPKAPLLRDSAGNLYGTTDGGGKSYCGYGCGVVFELPATTSPVFNVAITMSGNGTGTVASSPSGINCPPDCISAFPVGTTVTLSATPTGGSTFGVWSGNCSTTNANDCTVNSTQALSVGFNPPAPDFTISASVFTPAAVSPGSGSSSTITTAAIGGFSGSITLSCTVQSSVALAPTCSVSPASVNAGTTSVLMVSTTGPTGSMVSPYGSGFFYAAWLPVLGLLVGRTNLTRRNPRQKVSFRLACLLVAGALFQIACGGGSPRISNGGTPPGSYTIVVTAVSGSLQHSVTPNPTLTVQ